MRIVHANPGALLPKAPTLLRLQPDLLTISESRLHAGGINLARAELGPFGKGVYGKPVPRGGSLAPSLSTSQWAATPGGVAILSRNGMPIAEVPIGVSHPAWVAWRRLWRSGRCTGALVGSGSGSTPFYCFTYYGYSGAIAQRQPAYDNNEKALGDLFQVLSCFGDVPCIVCGDFKTNSEISPTLRAALGTGQWTDAALLWAERSGTAVENTFYPSKDDTLTSSNPSRLDAILMNRAATPSFKRLRVTNPGEVLLGGEKHRAKGHWALIAEFDWSRSRQLIKMWVAPKAFELPKKPPQPAGEQCLSYLESQGVRAADFEEALVAGDSVEALKNVAQFYGELASPPDN